MCIEHYAELCDCPHCNKTLRYRYTLEELPHMIHQLRMRAEMYDSWSTRAKSALTATPGEKLCKSWRDVLGVFVFMPISFKLS